MSKVTELTSGQITATETITVELIKANETPAVVIVRWPSKPSVIHPHRFPTATDSAARIFASAATRLAAVKRDRRL
jgi:hypothetical protein